MCNRRLLASARARGEHERREAALAFKDNGRQEGDEKAPRAS